MTGMHPIRGLIHAAAIVRRESRRKVLARLTRDIIAQGATPRSFKWDDEQPMKPGDDWRE